MTQTYLGASHPPNVSSWIEAGCVVDDWKLGFGANSDILNGYTIGGKGGVRYRNGLKPAGYLRVPGNISGLTCWPVVSISSTAFDDCRSLSSLCIESPRWARSLGGNDPVRDENGYNLTCIYQLPRCKGCSALAEIYIEHYGEITSEYVLPDDFECAPDLSIYTRGYAARIYYRNVEYTYGTIELTSDLSCHVIQSS